MANSKFVRWTEGETAGEEWVDVVGGAALVPNDDYVGRALKYFGDLDPKVSAIVDMCVSPGDVCLDIGANLGLISFRMSKRVGPQGVVHAFEPQPRMRSFIQRTVEANKIGNIRLHGIALGEHEGQLVLSIPDGNAGSASLIPNENSDAQKIEVPVKRLSNIAAELGLRTVAVIKIDVEGFEEFVIRGGTDFLRTKKPNVIIFEEHRQIENGVLPETLRLLGDLDYDLFALPRKFLRVRLEADLEGTVCHDYVAISRCATQRIQAAMRRLQTSKN